MLVYLTVAWRSDGQQPPSQTAHATKLAPDRFAHGPTANPPTTTTPPQDLATVLATIQDFMKTRLYLSVSRAAQATTGVGGRAVSFGLKSTRSPMPRLRQRIGREGGKAYLWAMGLGLWGIFWGGIVAK